MSTHPGRVLEADHLQQFLDGPQVDAVALIHAEFSTGTLAPLAELATVVRAQKDVLLLVDAAGSIGGIPVETDLWNLDFVFTGSDKALALPPGLALGVASQRFLERARTQEDRGRYFDVAWMDEALSRNHEPTSLPLPLLYALRAQLALIASAGGIEARWKRHHEMLTLVEEWALLRKDVQLLAQEGRRAWTCSCLRLPGGRSSADVVSSLRERGWLVASGWGTLKDSTIRIGHMGERTPGEVRELLGEMDSVLSA